MKNRPQAPSANDLSANTTPKKRSYSAPTIEKRAVHQVILLTGGGTAMAMGGILAM